MEQENKYLQTTGFMQLMGEIFDFIWKKRLLIIACAMLCSSIGLILSFIIKPKYEASLTFVQQGSDEPLGGMAGLASQFGMSLGGSSGAFSGDNIFELLISRNLTERALLSVVDINGTPTSLLNIYIKTYKMDEGWAKSKYPKVRELAFPLNQPRETFSREQDSIMLEIYNQFLYKNLITYKLDKKLSIGVVKLATESEHFSKLFVEKLMDVTTEFYVSTKTKVSRENLEVLVRQSDSIKYEYDDAVTALAMISDRNLNSIRKVSDLDKTKQQTEVQILAASYIEIKKSIEMLKMTINKQTPLVEIIDRPIYPLKVVKFRKLIGLVGGGFLGGFLSVGYFFSLFIWRNRRRLL